MPTASSDMIFFPKQTEMNMNVMQSRKISLNSNIFPVFYLIKVPIWTGTFCGKPYLNPTSSSKVMSN